jgi:hypothetical protein
LIDVIWQWWDAPLVASFERPTELSRWNWQNCRVEPTPAGATDGHSALRVDLLPGRYPGLRMIHPLPDWSRYQRLLIDVQLVDGPPLNIVVKIEDREHNYETEDRFQQVVQLVPGAQRIDIDLSAVANSPRERRMDMRRISTLSLFTVNLKSARTIYVDRIWLEGH